MVTQLKKITGSVSSRLPSSTRDVMYRIQLNSDVVKCVGGFECIVNIHDEGYSITAVNTDIDFYNKRPSKITMSYTLNIPKRLIDEWNDLCNYELSFDYENNTVYLIKVC